MGNWGRDEICKNLIEIAKAVQPKLVDIICEDVASKFSLGEVGVGKSNVVGHLLVVFIRNRAPHLFINLNYA